MRIARRLRGSGSHCEDGSRLNFRRAKSYLLPVALVERTASERILEARKRYVARGLSTPPLVVDRAEGARIWDVDGREYIDFAGGLGCQNLGHGHARGRRRDARAGRPLPAPVLHGRHVRAVRRGLPAALRALAVPGERAAVAARQLGRRGGRERGQDRARRHRPPRRHRLRPRLPRPHAADDDDDRARSSRTSAASARSRPRSTARRRRTRTAASTTDDAIAGLELLFKARRRPRVGRVRRARAGAGRGRLHPDAARTSRAG